MNRPDYNFIKLEVQKNAVASSNVSSKARHHPASQYWQPWVLVAAAERFAETATYNDHFGIGTSLIPLVQTQMLYELIRS
jgi:hypothetical protein